MTVNEIRTLWNKYQEGHNHGYLTDDELKALRRAADTAETLARGLGAGAASENYFSSLFYSLTNIMRTRGIEAAISPDERPAAPASVSGFQTGFGSGQR